MSCASLLPLLTPPSPPHFTCVSCVPDLCCCPPPPPRVYFSSLLSSPKKNPRPLFFPRQMTPLLLQAQLLLGILLLLLAPIGHGAPWATPKKSLLPPAAAGKQHSLGPVKPPLPPPVLGGGGSGESSKSAMTEYAEWLDWMSYLAVQGAASGKSWLAANSWVRVGVVVLVVALILSRAREAHARLVLPLTRLCRRRL